MTNLKEPATNHNRKTPLYLYDGKECIGHVLARGKLGFEAFDPNDKSIGIFASGRQAANALLLVKEGA